MRKYGRLRDALDLYVRLDLRPDIADLAGEAFRSCDDELCLEALTIIQDARELVGVGNYLAHFSTDWSEPFYAAARAVRRERRRTARPVV